MLQFAAVAWLSPVVGSSTTSQARGTHLTGSGVLGCAWRVLELLLCGWSRGACGTESHNR